MWEKYKNKRVFITGHTGFKGTWLCSVLEAAGAVTAGYSLAPTTELSHFDLLKSNEVSTIGDIKDADLLENCIDSFKPEILFHLAAQPLVRTSYSEPVNTYHINVMGTLNVLESVRKCSSIKAVVIITTDKVYENKEWLYPYRELDQLGGYDMYSSSKACAELLTSSYRRSYFNVDDYKTKHNVLLATARAGNVIGGGDWSIDRLIPDVIKATVNNKAVKIRSPKSIRPWQHVLDCITGYLLLGEKLLEEQSQFADAWNFSPYSFEAKTVGEVLTIAKEIWPQIEIQLDIRETNLHEASTLKLDSSKAFTELHWQPKWNTEKAIKQTINWYKQFYLKGSIETYRQIENYFSDNGDY